MTLRAYRLEYCGMQDVVWESIVWESSPGRARYQGALSLSTAGWIARADPSLVKCRRARDYDHIATAVPGRCYDPDWLPT